MPRVYEGLQVLPAKQGQPEYGKVYGVDREGDYFSVIIGPMEPLYFRLSTYERSGKLVGGGKRKTKRKTTRKTKRKTTRKTKRKATRKTTRKSSTRRN